MSTECDRLGPIPPAQMTDAQRRAVTEFVAARSAPLSGPFVPLLRSPEMLSRVRALGDYVRFGSALPAHVRELVTLTAARHWTQQYEWAVHVPLARAAGLAPAAIEAIAQDRRPGGLPPEAQLAYDLVSELQRTRAVADETYAAAVAAFGEQGVVEIVATCGYYTLLAMILNAARTPAPDSIVPPLGPLAG